MSVCHGFHAKVFVLLACSGIISGNVRKKRQSAISLGPLHHFAHGCQATDVKVIDEYTIELVDHHYHGDGPNAFYVLSNSDKFKVERADPRPLTVALVEGGRFVFFTTPMMNKIDRKIFNGFGLLQLRSTVGIYWTGGKNKVA